MSNIVALRTAIINSLATEVSQLENVRAHGGRFNLAELKRVAVRSPVALVAVLNCPVVRHGGTPVGNAQIAAFVVCHGTSQTNRDAQAPALAEAIAVEAAKNSWSYEYSQAPKDIRIDNLFSTATEKTGESLWAVTWSQQVNLGVDEDFMDSLTDFNQANLKIDLYPADGVYESDQTIDLQGTLMSSYGHIYISTPIATAIAAADTYQKAAGTTTLGEADDMDSPVTGRLRYTGSVQKPFKIDASLSVSVDSDAEVTLAIAKNGSARARSEISQDCTAAGGAEAFSLQDVVLLDEDDYLEVWVKADDTINVTVEKMSFAVIAG